MPKRDRLTRRQRWEQLEEDLPYDPSQLDRGVVSEGQIRTIIRTFKEKLFAKIFSGRAEVPKTLIFAKDDSHAEDISCASCGRSSARETTSPRRSPTG
ncbi:MAG TPA: hypothetical protein ENI39_01110 [Anaerolineae bacterium]|nr:hypothetical protein [Anaerolineae bacterium]